MQALKIIVDGKVQKVGYRRYIYNNARRLFLNGYVKNLDDGRVEILVIGEPQHIADMIKIAKKGPNYSWVYNVEIYSVEEELIDCYNDFKIDDD